MAPVGSGLGARRLRPDHLTTVGLVLAAVDAVVIATGHLFVGLVLLILSAVPDLLDGAVAKATGTASVRGAFFDSVADRVADSLVLGGIAWHLGTVGGRHVALLPFAVLATSTLISYERAKAESLGFRAKGGVMERAERIVVLAFGLAVPFLLVPALWVMLGLSLVTAVQRFVAVWRQAAPGGGRRAELTPRWTVAAVEARWRARREAAVAARRASSDRRFRVRRQPVLGGRHRARTRP